MMRISRRSRAAGLVLAAAVAGTSLLPTASQAEPGGCLKYGAVGAVGGHVAHHHAVLGAAGGCALGMYRRHKYRKEERRKARLYDEQQQQGSAPQPGG